MEPGSPSAPISSQPRPLSSVSAPRAPPRIGRGAVAGRVRSTESAASNEAAMVRRLAMVTAARVSMTSRASGWTSGARAAATQISERVVAEDVDADSRRGDARTRGSAGPSRSSRRASEARVEPPRPRQVAAKPGQRHGRRTTSRAILPTAEGRNRRRSPPNRSRPAVLGPHRPCRQCDRRRADHSEQDEPDRQVAIDRRRGPLASRPGHSDHHDGRGHHRSSKTEVTDRPAPPRLRSGDSRHVVILLLPCTPVYPCFPHCVTEAARWARSSGFLTVRASGTLGGRP